MNELELNELVGKMTRDIYAADLGFPNGLMTRDILSRYLRQKLQSVATNTAIRTWEEARIFAKQLGDTAGIGSEGVDHRFVAGKKTASRHMASVFRARANKAAALQNASPTKEK